ncbi:TPM domain-containing protein [Sphingobium sp. H39-3-25]|uniref:TPM domain-containing protein n=1 Tax=Sphingobium arseniciresistens TaxID=3030834 RepID=UPI0023B95C88|nr:TPM domain-containing protein [Sphingobium arseniciresistens]
MRWSWLAATALLLGCHDSAPERKPALELTGPVVDRANLIDPVAEASLVGSLETLAAETGVQFIVATTTSLDGREINEYSLDLARAWALGSKERSDGILLLVAPNERKVRIEVGRGLENIMKDEICTSIIRNDMMPAFKSKHMQEGILAGARATIGILYNALKRKAA